MTSNLGKMLARTKHEDESQQAGAEGQPHAAHVHLQSSCHIKMSAGLQARSAVFVAAHHTTTFITCQQQSKHAQQIYARLVLSQVVRSRVCSSVVMI
jgi:hypothetical protein